MEDRNDLRQILSEIDAALTRCTRQPDPQLLHADKWVLASGLQKAIRRGELRTAQSCAATLMQADKQMLWRRLQEAAPFGVELPHQVLRHGNALTRRL